MSAILYGNLSVEVVSDLGTRIERTVLRTAATGLLASRPPAALPRPRMLGRERESADARRAIRAGQPIGLHAACGYGKTTLLQHIVASAADDGVAPNCIYLRADGDRIEDLLHDLVTRLYTSARPVKLTAHECALVLAEVSAVVAVDDFSAGPDRVGQLLDALPGCRLVIGSARPVIGRRGSSQDLAGLSDDAALALLAEDLGRPLTSEEIPAAARLAAAVDGQPLHLRQAAALVREGSHTFTSLASQAAGHPAALDRLSVDALAEHERRALSVLALAAGALLPADVVAAIADVADLTESLGSLRRRGLAEQRDDRFGLPVCKAASYREMLLKNLQLGSAAHDLGAWLAARGPASSGSQSAADAALSIMDLAAELGDWAVVARLARAAESVLFLAGRWEAWHHVLGRGLEAAAEAGDRGAEAFFSHQLGSLAFCQDQLDDAVRLLQHAEALREQIGDRAGADLSRHNLQLLLPPESPQPPPRPPLSVRHRTLLAVASAAGALVLAAGTVAVASAVHGRGPGGAPSSGPASSAAVHSTTPSPSTGQESSTSTSTSSPEISVPNVVSESVAIATRELGDVGLSVGIQTQQCSDTAENDTVISTSPRAGEEAQPSSAVNLVESSGSCLVIVPDVIGETEDQASATLKDQGLLAEPADPLPSQKCGGTDKGKVVGQSPSGQTSVSTGAPVTINVCGIAG